MSKPLCIVSCPIETFSGYGARSRDFVKSLIKSKENDWDIKILSQRWGITPFGALDTDKEDDKDLKNRIVGAFTTNLNVKPDIWIQITVPNEFQNLGKFNIGVTAGIETTICSPQWIQGCNRMDLILVSSNHSKEIFETSIFEQKHTNGQTLGKIYLEKPIEVLFEGVDNSKYFKTDDVKKYGLYKHLNEIKENFCYLFVGHWLQGDLGEDRKNVGYLIKAFLEVFKNKPNKPALILKTSQATPSIMDRDVILKKIDDIRKSIQGNDLPNIYLLHGDMSDDEINCLYNHHKVKAMLSFTKGEGVGRPLLEFSVIGKPILASGWSGHMDFLPSNLCGLVGGVLDKVHPSAVVPDTILAESSWFRPDDNQVGYGMVDVFDKYNTYKEKAKLLASTNKQKFSMDSMTNSLNDILNSHAPQFPKQVQVVLPKLRKIE